MVFTLESQHLATEVYLFEEIIDEYGETQGLEPRGKMILEEALKIKGGERFLRIAKTETGESNLVWWSTHDQQWYFYYFFEETLGTKGDCLSVKSE